MSPIYTFSLAGNIIVHTPSQSTNKKKHYNYNNYKDKMPTLAGSKHLYVFHHRPRHFHLSMGNVRAYSVRNGHQSAYSHADKIIVSVNKDQQISNNRKIFLKFFRKDTNIILEFMILCLKCTYELTAFQLEKIWTGTRSFPSSFLISTRKRGSSF